MNLLILAAGFALGWLALQPICQSLRGEREHARRQWKLIDVGFIKNPEGWK